MSDQALSRSNITIGYAPRSSTPHAKSFSENLRVTLAAEVNQVGDTESLNEFFSSVLFVELRILVGSSIRWSTLKLGAEGKRKSGFEGANKWREVPGRQSYWHRYMVAGMPNGSSKRSNLYRSKQVVVLLHHDVQRKRRTSHFLSYATACIVHCGRSEGAGSGN